MTNPSSGEAYREAAKAFGLPGCYDCGGELDPTGDEEVIQEGDERLFAFCECVGCGQSQKRIFTKDVLACLINVSAARKLARLERTGQQGEMLDPDDAVAQLHDELAGLMPDDFRLPEA